MSNRIYYAVQKVGIGAAAGGSCSILRGVQSVSVGTTFSVEPIKSLGQISAYDSIENSHDVNVTIKRLLDGSPSIYSIIAAKAGASPSMEDIAMAKCSVGISIADDDGTTALASMQCTDMYLSSFKYVFSTEGNFEEEVSLIGDNKTWTGGAGNGFKSTNSPIIARRKDFLMGSSILPTSIPANSNIASISISVNINRENIAQFGSRTPFFRLPTFPIETVTEISVIAKEKDTVETKIDTPCGTIVDSTIAEKIYIAICEGTNIDLGINNKLVSTTYGGGDATGGNVKINYTYKNWD